MSQSAENDAPTCSRCGRLMTAAYDDLGDSWWECDPCPIPPHRRRASDDS